MPIFRTDSGKLIKLKTTDEGKYFSTEKEIQGLVEHNISEIFTDLEFIRTEYQIENLRIDTIAFDKERNSFVIIEYKNKQDEDVLAQGISYYQLMMDKKGEFVILYNKAKNENFDIDDINWDETRIIFISPKFTHYQLMASGFAGLPTEFYEIKKYQDNILTLNRIDQKQEKSSRKDLKRKIQVTISEYHEEDYLAGKYETTPASPETIKLWRDFKNLILDSFDKLEFKQKKKYGGFYSTEDNSCICTLDAQKNAIWLSYSTTKKNFFEDTDFVTYTTKGHFGVGHYRSKITSNEDVDQAIPFIHNVYEDKVGSA